MKRRHLLGVLTAALLVPATLISSDGSVREGAVATDSAASEMRIGRFWHATRLLRAAGAAEGAPAQVLLLARAEAGWHHWSAVVDLLEGADWLDETGHGEGWRLLGRAEEDAGEWDAAAAAYGTYLRGPGGRAPDAPAIRVRRARSLALSGRTEQALALLDSIEQEAGALRSWTAVELARDRADAGDTTGVRLLLARVLDPRAASETWRLEADARLAAGDTAGALEAFKAAMSSVTGARRGVAEVEAGILALDLADTVAARPLLRGGMDRAPAAAAGRAASALLDITSPDRKVSLELARILDRSGNGRDALRAYDRVVSLARHHGVEVGEGARLARARLMATVRARQGEAVKELRALSTSRSERIGAASLDTWAALRRGQGRTGDVRTLRKWLIERYPSSPEALEVRWTEADRAATRGDLTAAVKELSTLADAAPTRSRAGEARMRIGQIELGRGHVREASEVFGAYLRDFPSGRHWEDASYWAARTRLELGDTVRARELVARVRRAEPVSYYAVMGADLLGDSFDVSVPEGEKPVRPGWLTEGLRRLDLLDAAGLDEGADAEVDRLIARAGSSEPVCLSLAEALIDRGRTVDGINLGWKRRADGHPWDRRLLRVVYPFPYRQLVVREAAEWDVSPFLLAALIRQESAFDAQIVSGAGAIGLMQLMPPTGKALARVHGPVGLSEQNLTTPEVNLHLGAAFLVEMARRYHGDLPLVLSAYNAGPTRATRWSRYPEASDPQRFTERIPFAETRGYVKNVRRNLGVYQALYDLE